MKFYRYQPINQLSLRNLARGQNWISDPKQFNDPFEFNIVNDYIYDSESGNKDIAELEMHNLDMVINLIENFGVICYSTNETNGLLWSHYADNHRGMVLEFDIPKDYKIRKVNYQSIMPDLKLDDDDILINEALKICTTKSKIWKYEEEYREILRIKNDYNPYPGKLIGIIFGCKANYEDIKIASSIAREINPEIKISKMGFQTNTYFLTKCTIGDNKKIPKFWKNSFNV